MYIITILCGRNCQALLSAFFVFFYLYPYGQKLMQPRARNISAAHPAVLPCTCTLRLNTAGSLLRSGLQWL